MCGWGRDIVFDFSRAKLCQVSCVVRCGDIVSDAFATKLCQVIVVVVEGNIVQELFTVKLCQKFVVCAWGGHILLAIEHESMSYHVRLNGNMT